jgi:hypothetical protein
MRNFAFRSGGESLLDSSYANVTRREPTRRQPPPDVCVEGNRGTRESSCLFRRRRRRETALDTRIARLGTDSPRGVSEEDDVVGPVGAERRGLG